MGKLNRIFSVTSLFMISFLFILLTGCGEGNKKEAVSKTAGKSNIKEVSDAMSKYVRAFTAGEISKTSNIIVRFAAELADGDEVGKIVSDSPIEFSPSIKGEFIWKDKRTIEFTPSDNLEPGKSYTANINVDKLYKEVPDKFKIIQFHIRVKPSLLDIKFEPLMASNNHSIELQKLKGEIVSTDIEDSEKIEKILKVVDKNNELEIIWNHLNDKVTHIFQVENIKRGKRKRELKVSWNAGSMGIDFKGSEKITVHKLTNFKFVKAVAKASPERHIVLSFSDPLKQNQMLNGLIHIKNKKLKYVIDGNIVKVYPAANSIFTGKIVVNVEPGIKNAVDDKISRSSKVELKYNEIKPQVKLTGRGIIAPNSSKIYFPFKAVNLSAVDIQIVKIYEENIHQFFQVNDYQGRREIYRVGKVVLEKRVELDLENKLNLSEWNDFSFDLSKFVNLDPGSIYQVSIGFQMDYSLFPCVSKTEAEYGKKTASFRKAYIPGEESYWDYGYYGYSWRDRQDPCHIAYYGSRRSVTRNIFASDLGIIAKGAENGEYNFVITDINTTQPTSGVDIEIYDYQNRQIKTLTTDGEGFAKIKLEEKPFLLVAKKGKQRGYLKLLGGRSLSLSRFDISGKSLHKGIKGFLYGERGVWRPGDEIYLTFILEDPENVLPKEHPVSFDFIDSRGQLVKRIVATESVNNFYSFHVKTDKDAPTGNYRAVVKVGGAEFAKNIKVETIKPNRLKINFDLDEDYIVEDDGFAATLDVKWLHGAVAKNLDAKIDVTLSPAKTKFDKYHDYSFDNPATDYESHTENIFDKKIDRNGRAVINIDLEANENAPGRLNAKFMCKVFEPGGSFSRDQFTIPYYSYPVYVGVNLPKGDKRRGMLLTDKDHEINVVTLNPEGKPVKRKNLEVNVYKVSWKWWWDHSNENLSNYNVRSSKKAILTKKINTDNNGKGTSTFKIKYPEWGRYLVMVSDADGHTTGKIVYVDWPGWAGRPQAKQPGGATMLTFSAEKEKYQVGEDIKLMIPSSDKGRALVSLETGSRVVNAFWVETKKGMTELSFKATSEMAPNIYAHVTLLQPHAQTQNDLPIRMYGVIPIAVEDPETKLKPEIKMADVLRPEEEFEIKVSETNGREMTYTLAVVDEGLLDLTRFKTPDPWKNFYSRSALKVKTWDIFDEIMTLSGREFDHLLAVGGDGESLLDQESQVNRFKPVVKFVGPFNLEKGKTKTHKLKMPMYVGSVKTMVVAGDKGAYGKTSKATPVRKPLMLLGTLPRVLAPTEELEFYLTVFAMEENVKNVTVSIETDNLIGVKGKKSKSIKFNEPGDKLVAFPIKVNPEIGVAKVKAKAVSGSETAEYNFTIEIRNPNPPVSVVDNKLLRKGEEWNFNAEGVGIKGTNSGNLEITSIPPFNLSGRLKYLIRYPHGCVEQTTSAVFPQLFLKNLMLLSDQKKERISQNIKAGIEQLAKFQLTNGAMGYWPSSTSVNEWGTNYAGHFMIEAEKEGYALPPGFKTSWINFQTNSAESWTNKANRSEYIQAYRLFLLSLAGSPSYGSMNRFRESKIESNVAKWLLAGSYYLAGQIETAKKMTRNLSTEVKQYDELSYTYGSGLRDKAIILMVLNLMKKEEQAFIISESIAERLNQNRWYSTQTTGYSLMAIAKNSGSLNSPLKFSYSLNGKDFEVELERPVEQIDLDFEKNKTIKIKVKNTSDKTVYAKVIRNGVPQIGKDFDSESNIKLNVQYKTEDGDLLDPANIEQGTDFVAEVTVKNPGRLGNYKELALTQIFPSGWEIHNPRMYSYENNEYDIPTYQDIRDDRVYSYFDLKRGKTKKFIIRLNAAYTGRFYLPAVNVEAMYKNSINSRKRGMWVEVYKKNNK